MISKILNRVRSWWRGKLIAGEYDPENGLLIFPYEDRPRIFWQIKAVLDFLRPHWKFLVTTSIAIAAILISRR